VEAEAARKHAGEEEEAVREYERAAEAARKCAARAPYRFEREAEIARSREALAVTTRVAVEPGAPPALLGSQGQMKPKQPRGPMTDPGLQTRAVLKTSADAARAPNSAESAG
jgi:hypothetical protein